MTKWRIKNERGALCSWRPSGSFAANRFVLWRFGSVRCKRPPMTQQRPFFAPGLFSGQVAIITGGGSGIGLACAGELASLGARVAICGRKIDKIEVGAPPADHVARYRQGATVTIRAQDGRVSTSTVYMPKGAAALGIAWNDVDAKFRTLVPAAGLSESAIEACLALIHDFRQLSNVSDLVGSLRVGGSDS